MPQETIAKGIVLKATPFKENDLILSVYFKEYGKLSILANGVRKPKSKNANAVLPMMYSEFTFYLRQGLCKLVRAQVSNSFRYIFDDLNAASVATYICEYYYRAIEENNPNLDHFNFLYDSIHCLNSGYDPLLVYALAMAFMLKDGGSAAIVDHCSVCEEKKIYGVSVVSGGFVCQNHFNQIDDKLSFGGLKLFRHINKINISRIDELAYEQEELKEVIKVLEKFVHEYASVQLKSSKFIKC